MTKETGCRRAGQTITLRLGDSFELLQVMDEESIGAVVCDPPYG